MFLHSLENRIKQFALSLLYHSPIAHVALYGTGLSLVLPQLWFVFAFSIKVCMYI